ncbi:hypothetical protein DH2020_035605 [Rehmannia glutinosa]|uniref:laccase n=1 Tax=Rehmannia glutinosa TaxID=99300 RepID=A0ABR0V9H8_REHGL
MASGVYAIAGDFDNSTTTGIVESPELRASVVALPPDSPKFQRHDASFNFTSRSKPSEQNGRATQRVTKSLLELHLESSYVYIGYKRWHGVKMPRYPWSDGPEYVTQCPISPGTKFSQRIVLSDEEGTLWWHAHSEWSRASVYGEWWNADVQEVMEEFLASGGDPNVSDAFLINGQPGDLYPCSRQGTYRLSVEFGKTYLIRMINAVMNNIMFFKITNHNITVVGSDGAYTKPLTSDYITISPGQTIDFLLHANQPPSHYYMASRVYASAGNYDNTTTTGIIEYVGNYTPPSSLSLPIFPNFNDTAASVNFTSRLRSLANEKYPIDVPLNVTDILFFTLSINLRPCVNNSCDGRFDERLLASVNNVTMLLPRTDILQVRADTAAGIGTDVNILEYNATVELRVPGGRTSVDGIDHPMHLHVQFLCRRVGFGNFGENRDPANYNLVDPPMETIAILEMDGSL